MSDVHDEQDSDNACMGDFIEVPMHTLNHVYAASSPSQRTELLW